MLALALGCRGSSSTTVVAVDEPSAIPEPCAGAEPCVQTRATAHVDPVRASEAAERPLDVLVTKLGLELERELAWAPEPMQSCKVNGEGECVYTPREHRERETSETSFEPIPYADGERELLEAFALYERHAEPDDTLRAVRRHHVRLRLDHHDYDEAVPLLESFVLDYGDHGGAVWAASALIDALVIQMTNTREGDAVVIERLSVWIDRLPTLPLWTRDDASELRASVLALRRGVAWQHAMVARDEGVVAWEQAKLDGIPPSLESFERCAERFVAIAEAFPDERPDAALWNAAICFDAAAELERAVLTRVSLLERYPNSEFTRDNLRNLAVTEHVLLRWDAALAHYFEFARRYPNDWDNLHVLTHAYAIASAVAPARAERALELLEALYDEKDPSRAARWRWAARPESARELEDHGERFLQDYRRKWYAGHLDALRVLGELGWAAACSERLDDGLCVARREPAETTDCTLSGSAAPELRRRKAKRSAAALERFETISRQRGKSLPLTTGFDESVDPPLIAEAFASALFHAIEPRLEAFLIAGPDAPDALAQAEQLDTAYLEVVALDHVPYAIRAHARRARVWELLANPGLERRDGVCHPVDEHAAELRRRTIAAYEDCLVLAVRNQWFTEPARRCEAALGRIKPEEVPPLPELLGEPSVSFVGVRSAGVQAPWVAN